MIKARKNPQNGRYVLYVGDSRGLAYYLAGVDGIVDLFSRPVREFQERFAENHPEHLRRVVEQFRSELPDGWAITAKASEQLSWATNLLRKNPKSQGETTMSDVKAQPKLSAAKKPGATPVKPAKALAAEEKPSKAKKAEKAEATETEGGKGRKNPYAGLKIQVISKEIAAREGSLRHEVLSAIISSKKVDDVYGTTVTDANGKEATVNTAWLNFAKGAGLVDFV